MANQDTMQLEFVQESLNQKIEDQNLEVQRKKKVIEKNQSGRVHANSKSKSLSQKIMANYMVRMMNMGYARGFYTWKDNMTTKVRSQRVLGKFLTFWMKNQLYKGFRKWADTHNLLIKDELEGKRKDK